MQRLVDSQTDLMSVIEWVGGSFVNKQWWVLLLLVVSTVRITATGRDCPFGTHAAFFTRRGNIFLIISSLGNRGVFIDLRSGRSVQAKVVLKQ